MGLGQAIVDRISQETSVSSKQVQATLQLLEGEATVPFIARYRKEVTGNLDEVQIRAISERQEYYKSLLERRDTILRSIEEQGKLSEELKASILACFEKASLEDLYLPYKPKRKTRANVAIEKGLEPLARFIFDQVPGDRSIEELAETFVNPEKQVNTREEAVEGALHIVAEWISESLEIRKKLRDQFLKEGKVLSRVNKDKAGQKTKFEMYYDFHELVSKIPSHRVLAIRRGVKEQVLNQNIEVDREKALQTITAPILKQADSSFSTLLQTAIKDSYDRLLNPSLQGEVRVLLKERSDREATKVFEENLTNLLLSPPAGPLVVMGVDPGFRTGCKVAIVDGTGKFLEHATIYPTEPKLDLVGSERTLYRLIQKYRVQAIVIGNGTGCREANVFVQAFLKKYKSGELLGEAPQVIGEGSKDAEQSIAQPSSSPEASPVSSESAPVEDATGIRTEEAPGELAERHTVSAAGNEMAMPEQAVSDEKVPAITGAATLTEAREPIDEVPAERHEIFSVIVNESGASVYSASESARREFPKLDLTVRGAISIARRLQDPLAELVKIHPKSIGVGQYQHDVDQKRLKEGLEAAVESCVNRVGVDVNLSSYELLRYCSGINQGIAKAIIDYRNAHGPFTQRAHLMQVPGFGEKTFEQAAGFLRIKGGENPLDATAVHPESYGVVERIAQFLGLSIPEILQEGRAVESLDLQQFVDETVGLYTLNDIRHEILKPGRDPRDQFVAPAFREDVKEVADLQPGMVLEGTVTNVTNFGAFIDIGVHQDGLVHVSELSTRFVQDPREAIHVGEIVKVKVIGVDVAMKRISLSIKALQPERKKAQPARKAKAFRASKHAPPPRAAAASAGSKGKAPQSQEAKSSPRPTAKEKPTLKSPALDKPRQTGTFAKKAEKAESTHKTEKKAQPRKLDAPASISALPFDEQIRRLQEKFSGIR